MRAVRVFIGVVMAVALPMTFLVAGSIGAAHGDNIVNCGSGGVGGDAGNGGTANSGDAIGGSGGSGGAGQLPNCDQNAVAGANAVESCWAGGGGGPGGDGGDSDSGPNGNALEVGTPGSANGGVAFGTTTADANAASGNGGDASGGNGGHGGIGTAPDCSQNVTDDG